MTERKEKHWIIRNIPWIITTVIALVVAGAGFWLTVQMQARDISDMREELDEFDEEMNGEEGIYESMSIMDRDLFRAEDDIIDLKESIIVIQDSYTEQMVISREVLKILKENN